MPLGKFAAIGAAASLILGSVLLAQEAPAQPGGNTSVAVPAPPQAARRPVWIGIEASPLTPALARQLRFQPGVGLLVDRVTDDSPAAKAGIKQYDVLQKVDGHLIDDPTHFVSLFIAHRPGDVVNFTLIREGQAIDANVTLGQPGAAPGPAVAPPAPKHHSHGLRVPKINVRIDERGDLVATDESGHTLFRQPLDFTIDTPELPFTIHIEPKPGKPDQPPADSQGR